MRAFLFERVYQDSWRHEEERKCDFILTRLYEHFSAHCHDMPEEYLVIAQEEGVDRGVTDYLASMTDRFAMRLFDRLFVPEAFTVI